MAKVRNGSEIYRLIVERMLDRAIFMLDADGRAVTWNAGAERITGYCAGEAIGHHVSVFYPRDDVRSGKPERELLTAGAINRFEYESWRIRKDGARFWAHVVITAIRDEAGELLGFVNLMQNLTEQKRLEAELRRSQERFQNGVESAPNAIIMVNRTGRIEMLNLQAECMFGYSRDELLGQPVEMLIPQRFRGAHPGHRMSFFAYPKARSIGAGRDLCALRKDGSEFPVEIGLSPIETEEGSTVLAAIVDVTDRKRHQEELKRSEERFQNVVESLPNALVIVDTNYRIEMLNFQAERMFGYPREELLGQPLEVLIPERFRRQHIKLEGSFFANPRRRPMAGRKLFALKRDGTEFPVEIGLSPLQTEQGLKVIAFIADITVRKQMEEQIAAAVKEKDALIAEVHHRVRNTLQITQSMLRLQGTKIEDQSALDIFMDCQSRIDCMALIHHTLYQSGDFAKVDFASFLKSLALALINAYYADPNRITLSIDAGQVFLPIGTAVSLGQIANELLTNALKHAFPGGRGGNITVTLAKEADDVVFSVADDGTGIPSDLGKPRRTTLGLRLVSLLADQLRGTLSIERSGPTRFTLRFPLRDGIMPGKQAALAASRSFA